MKVKKLKNIINGMNDNEEVEVAISIRFGSTEDMLWCTSIDISHFTKNGDIIQMNLRENVSLKPKCILSKNSDEWWGKNYEK